MSTETQSLGELFEQAAKAWPGLRIGYDCKLIHSGYPRESFQWVNQTGTIWFARPGAAEQHIDSRALAWAESHKGVFQCGPHENGNWAEFRGEDSDVDKYVVGPTRQHALLQLIIAATPKAEPEPRKEPILIALEGADAEAFLKPAPSPAAERRCVDCGEAVAHVAGCPSGKPPSPSPDSVLKVAEDMETLRRGLTFQDSNVREFVARLRAIAERQEDDNAIFAAGMRVGEVSKSTPSPQASELADRLGRWWQAWASETTWGGNKELMEILDELRTLSAPRPGEKAEAVPACVNRLAVFARYRCEEHRVPLLKEIEAEILAHYMRWPSTAPSPSATPKAVTKTRSIKDLQAGDVFLGPVNGKPYYATTDVGPNCRHCVSLHDYNVAIFGWGHVVTVVGRVSFTEAP